DVGAAWSSKPPVKEDAPSEPPGVPAAPAGPPAVVMQPQSIPWLGQLPGFLGSAVQAVGGLAMALVLVVFMLLKREDLRNRFLRLVCHGRMSATTKAVDDAGRRISRYLLMQLVINGGFGLALTSGLLLIGVPHAFLLGFLAAVLRYVPYLGVWVTALVLLTLSLASFPGWVQPILVVILI